MAKKSKYYTHVLPKLELIESWYRNGAIDEDVASNLNVGYSTYLKYKNMYPELLERTIVGKEETDLRIESDLYKRARGYTTVVTEEKLDRSGNIRVLKKEIHVPGDVGAQIFWLKNRCPDKWRDKQDVSFSGEAQVLINDDIPTKSKGS